MLKANHKRTKDDFKTKILLVPKSTRDLLSSFIEEYRSPEGFKITMQELTTVAVTQKIEELKKSWKSTRRKSK
jgi:hypothetical protein